MNVRSAIIALGACTLVSACSPLAPQPDYSKFFILTPISYGQGASAVQASAPAGPSLTIGLGPIDFPGYLRRLDVVTRSSPNELDLSPDKRWSEPLDQNFERVLADNLATLLGTERIEKYPWPRRTQIDYQITIDVQRFETDSNQQSALVARWIIKDGTGKDLSASRTAASSPVGAGDAGASIALSSDLATLSRDIAARVSELGRRPAASTNSTATSIRSR